MKNKQLPPIHPGEILMDEFLEPMGMNTTSKLVVFIVI
jgi:plasmid maintenance system antidote protein VapI